MNIELSAAKAWKEANASCDRDEAEMVASEMVTDNVIARLEAGDDVNFLYEIGKIIQDTDGDEATQDLLLHEIMGIAEKQSILAYEQVEGQIRRQLTHATKLAL